jgi:hypothetical protein
MRKVAILVGAASFLFASPALALICTATDDQGHEYKALHRVKNLAVKEALKNCRANSSAPETCEIKACGTS